MTERIRFPVAPAISSTVKDGNFGLVPHISYQIFANEEVVSSTSVVGSVVNSIQDIDRVYTLTFQLWYIDTTKATQYIDGITANILGVALEDLNPPIKSELDVDNEYDPEIVFLTQFDNRNIIKTIDIYAELNRVKKKFLARALERFRTQVQQAVTLNT